MPQSSASALDKNPDSNLDAKSGETWRKLERTERSGLVSFLCDDRRCGVPGITTLSIGVLLLAVALSGFFLFLGPSAPTSLDSRRRVNDTVVNAGNPKFSHSVAKCPGYTFSSVKQSESGLTGKLNLAGPACNAFGNDLHNLNVEVTYELSRLHVNIYDTYKTQFTIPKDVVPKPASPKGATKDKSDLVFNYEPSPFAFWITRKGEPDAAPLFDTRISSLPTAPIPPIKDDDPSAGFEAFPLVFEDRYLQLTSALHVGANIYGLGDVVASSGFRRDTGANGGKGTIQTLWARDVANPEDQNIYGVHPIYLEHRFNATTSRSSSHGVYLHNVAGSDVLIATPKDGTKSLIQYRLLGGVLDMYFVSGPTPLKVIEQYADIIGHPILMPYWAFGFHLCRWGYTSVEDVQTQVTKMREANVPLEVMWSDIDLYHAYRDFTTDPTSYPIDKMKKLTADLRKNHQRYIPIVDAAIAVPINETDVVEPYNTGVEQKVFTTKADGSTYVGKVWPGYTVYPDWFASNTTRWWFDNLRKWYQSGVEFSGIWLDMNEVSSFCDGSCGDGADLTDTSTPFILPGLPGNLVTDFPECYDVKTYGTSGNLTVNGHLTCTLSSHQDPPGPPDTFEVRKTDPPYAIHNGNGPLSIRTVSINATHANGWTELDTHNLWGLMEEQATYTALTEVFPGKRPFIISRSTAPSSGKVTGHWLGDNASQWRAMYLSIQGVLQFQLFQVPFVGADACGFGGNTDEELCNRWMQLSAFHPFYRNHNMLGAIPQEPYRWDSVAEASRVVIAARYTLLPYWYTLFYRATENGTPPLRALFFEFPDEPELFGIDKQFMVGRDILVTPVLVPNTSTVDGIFPGRGSVTWRDWFTHEVVKAESGKPTTLAAPLGHINVHFRSGSVFLLHSKPSYTTTETRSTPYSMLISLGAEGDADGSVYIDDGESLLPTPSRNLAFSVQGGKLTIKSQGNFKLIQKLDEIIVLGMQRPTRVTLDGAKVNFDYEDGKQKLSVKSVGADLNENIELSWV